MNVSDAGVVNTMIEEDEEAISNILSLNGMEDVMSDKFESFTMYLGYIKFRGNSEWVTKYKVLGGYGIFIYGKAASRKTTRLVLFNRRVFNENNVIEFAKTSRDATVAFFKAATGYEPPFELRFHHKTGLQMDGSLNNINN